ncbi:MAG: hypothetical protein ACSNEK_08355 [Parachlamydiaceae bacterium]
MKNFIPWFCFVLCFLLVSWDDTPRCFHNLEMDFFERGVVMQALSVYNTQGVYQSQWSLIYLELLRRQGDIPKLIKENAKKMNPNPLQYPFQPDKAEEVFLKTLYGIFRQAISKHASVNDETVQGMFRFIIEKQTKKLDACFGKKNRIQDRKTSSSMENEQK